MVGVITDDDLRRKLREKIDIFALKAQDIMSFSPKKIGKNEYAVNALNKMQQLSIAQIGSRKKRTGSWSCAFTRHVKRGFGLKY